MENPVERTATVAEILRRPAVSADPQVVGAAPFRMAMGPERIWGTFNLTRQEEADEMIKRITMLSQLVDHGHIGRCPRHCRTTGGKTSK